MVYAAVAKERQGERTDLIDEDIKADLPESKPWKEQSREQAAKVVGTSGRAGLADLAVLAESGPVA